MGTRAQTLIYDGDILITNIYCHSDGYPSGHYQNLLDILNNGNCTITNGIMGNCPVFFNGMGCLAAWLVKGLKNGSGGIYLSSNDPLRDKPKWWPDYTYILRNEDCKLKLEFMRRDIYLYKGLMSEASPEHLNHLEDIHTRLIHPEWYTDKDKE